MKRVNHIFFFFSIFFSLLIASCIPVAPEVVLPTMTTAPLPTIQVSTQTTVPKPTNTLPPSIPPTNTPDTSLEGKFILPQEDAFSAKFHLSPDGSLAGVSVKDKLYVFHTRPFELAYTINTPDGSGNFAFSANGKLGAITLGGDPRVQLFDAQNGSFTQVLEGGKSVNDLLLFSADSSKLAGILSLANVEMWDIASGQYLGWLLVGGDNGKIGLNYFGDVLSKGGELRYMRSGEPVPSENWMHSPSTIFTPLGLCIRNVENKSPEFTIAHGPDFETNVQGVAVYAHGDQLVISSSDESLVAVQDQSYTIQIIDAYSAKIIKTDTLEQKPGSIQYFFLDIAFTPDGKLVELIKDQSTENKIRIFIREINPKE